MRGLSLVLTTLKFSLLAHTWFYGSRYNPDHAKGVVQNGLFLIKALSKIVKKIVICDCVQD